MWSCCGTTALQERFYFGDTVLPLFESGIPLLRERVARLPDRDNVTVAYPDEGAWKRFHYQFGDYPEVSDARLIWLPLQCAPCTLRNSIVLCMRPPPASTTNSATTPRLVHARLNWLAPTGCIGQQC
jgi:hypothetical protein